MNKIIPIVLFATAFSACVEAIEPNRHPQRVHQRARAFDRQILARDNLARQVVARVVLREVQKERRRQEDARRRLSNALLYRCSHCVTPQHKTTIANSFVNYLRTLPVTQQQTLVTKILNTMSTSQKKNYIRKCQQEFPHKPAS